MPTREQDPAGSRGSADLDARVRFKVLTPQQIRQIDEALSQVGPFAEVRLIKQSGKLRFIQRLEREPIAQPD